MSDTEQSAQDKGMLVGLDPYSDRLAVIPLAQAQADVAMIAALSGSTTFGEVRRNADAWAAVHSAEPPEDFAENVEQDFTGDIEQIPDETPFDWVEWFGDESYYLRAPLARLQTAEYCPEPVMAEFGREDAEIGFVDYVPATWLSPKDQERVETRLVELGFEVVHDSQILSSYNY